MVKKAKKLLKNSKGFTLVELLAVIVILGIIAAIAVPSVGNIIDNSKKDAHIANAKQMVEAARLMVANEGITISTTGIQIDATGATAHAPGSGTYDLVKGGYLESPPKDPDGGTYSTAKVEVKKAGTPEAITYSVQLVGSKRQINGGSFKEISSIARTDITDK